MTVTVTLYEPTLTVTGPATGNIGERLEFSGTFGADGITFPRTIITVSRTLDADLAAAFDRIDHSNPLNRLGTFPARGGSSSG